MVMLSLMWAIESMPRGGEIKIDATRLGEETAKFNITASGIGAQLREGAREVFENSEELSELNPKLVHSAAIGYYASSYGIQVSVAEGDGQVSFTVTG